MTTLHNNFDNLWNETRLFLQTRFQVPYVCHVLLMRKPYLIHQGRVIVAILERLAAIVDQLTFFEVGFFLFWLSTDRPPEGAGVAGSHSTHISA